MAYRKRSYGRARSSSSRRSYKPRYSPKQTAKYYRYKAKAASCQSKAWKKTHPKKYTFTDKVKFVYIDGQGPDTGYSMYRATPKRGWVMVPKKDGGTPSFLKSSNIKGIAKALKKNAMDEIVMPAGTTAQEYSRKRARISEVEL